MLTELSTDRTLKLEGAVSFPSRTTSACVSDNSELQKSKEIREREGETKDIAPRENYDLTRFTKRPNASLFCFLAS